MINLLPPAYQKELKQEENRRLTVILGMLFLVFLISLILILFSVKLYIQGQLASVKILADSEEKTLLTPQIQDLQGKINSANRNLAKLALFYGSQISAVGILEKIFKTIPSEIYLTAFSWQKDTSQVTISGFSPTREVLFNFQRNLEAAKEFTDFNFPSQNWIKSSNIDFYVSFKIAK